MPPAIVPGIFYGQKKALLIQAGQYLFVLFAILFKAV